MKAKDYKKKLTALRHEIVDDITNSLLENGIKQMKISSRIPFVSPRGSLINEYHCERLIIRYKTCYVRGNWRGEVQLMNLNAHIKDFSALLKVKQEVDSILGARARNQKKQQKIQESE